MAIPKTPLGPNGEVPITESDVPLDELSETYTPDEDSEVQDEH